MKRTISISILTIFILLLSACGGSGGSSGSENTDILDLEKWELIDTGTSPIAIGLERQNNTVYMSLNAFNNNTALASTTDGLNLQYFTTNNTSELISFIDETNRIHLRNSHSDNGVTFINKTDQIPFGGLMTGSSSAFIANTYMTFKNTLITDPLKMSFDGGDTWSGIDLDTDISTREFIMPTEPAFNGSFLLADFDNGLWLSNNSGANWSKILVGDGHFEAVAANTHFPNRFYAAQLDALYRSDDNGSQWTIKTPSDLINQSITQWLALVLADDGALYAWGVPSDSIDDRGQVFSSTDGGATWTLKGEPIGYSRDSFIPLTTAKMVVNDNYIFVIDDDKFYKLSR